VQRLLTAWLARSFQKAKGHATDEDSGKGTGAYPLGTCGKKQAFNEYGEKGVFNTSMTA
jgi:hypothetical protein